METFGSSIPQYVADQIQKREAAFANNSKSRLQQQLLNSNTAWVKLRSSVNKISDNEAQALLEGKTKKEAIGSNIIAQNYVLLGGTLNSESRTPRAGILRSPVSDNPNAQGRPAALNRDTEAYLNYDSIGFRPMPGITSLSVSHKNTYGTLMQATVNFTVWSKEQLDDIELLYFRPGYTALLEWGHSVYIQGNEVEFAGSNMTVPEDVFFNRQQAIDSIDLEIESRRKIYKGNYQGLFGFITNFNWSFRSDGGYDCEIKIVSKGIVLESIKNTQISDHLSEAEVARQKKKEETEKELKSSIHMIFQNLAKAKFTNYSFFAIKDVLSTAEVGLSSFGNKIQKQLKNPKTTYGNPSEDIKVFGFRVAVQNEGGVFNRIGALLAGKDNLSYISIRSFLAIINAFELLKDSSGTGDIICPFSLGYGNTYTTYPRHFSVNPFIALLPKPVGKFLVGETNNSLNVLMSKETGGRKNDILDIYISSAFLLQEITKLVERESEDGVGILDFIKNILGGIEFALGGINQFDIFFDETNQQYQIIDRKSPAIKDKSASTINVTGLKNTVVDLSINSTISKNISSQISIAAQGNTGNYKENLQQLLQWNLGAIDRHILSKDQTVPTTPPDSSENIEKKKSIEEKIEEAYSDLNGAANFWTTSTLDVERLSDLANEASALHNTAIVQHQVDRGIIEHIPVPVKLQIKLLGISGLKIGTVFNINDLPLPSKYKKFSYIITGIVNDIGTDNKWYTTIDALMYQTGK